MSRPATGILSRLLLVSMVLAASGAAPVHALEPVHYWSKGLGGGGIDLGTAATTDPAGSVVMAGYFNGTVNLGGGNLVSAGGSDIFLAKYTAGGTHVWSLRLGSTTADIPVSIATDGAGNIFLTGFFTGTVDFGGGGLVSRASSTRAGRAPGRCCC
jgi:hypothetical protein